MLPWIMPPRLARPVDAAGLVDCPNVEGTIDAARCAACPYLEEAGTAADGATVEIVCAPAYGSLAATPLGALRH